jgi:outer membrane protein TolC
MKTFLVTLIFAGGLLAHASVTCAANGAATSNQVLGLDECIRLALASAPELGEAQADIELANSKLEEAKSHRLPQVELTALFGPAPDARREDLYPTITTDRKFKLSELTWFASADATIIQPLYTFGKISENMKAATHGIEVGKSRKQQSADEIALKVREYYNGLLLARETKELILEVQESLDKARDKARNLINQDSESVDESDLYKLDSFSGMAAKYLEEASKGEKLALAALKTRLNIPAASGLDIKDERLVMPETAVPELESFVDLARNRRPEFRQLSEGLKARSALVEAAKANYYPDIFLGGLVSWAYADDRDRIDNPYINDKFKHMNAGIALGARWKLDFGITEARVSAEQAQYNRLLSTKEFADANIPLQVQKYYLELKEAEVSVVATKMAYSNAKKWAVTALANFDFGVGPAKDIFDSLQVYATMRAEYFKSIYNYHMAQAHLDYATSEPPLAITK